MARMLSMVLMSPVVWSPTPLLMQVSPVAQLTSVVQSVEFFAPQTPLRQVLPDGQLLFTARDRLLRRVAERRNILVPSLVADKRVEETDDKPSDEVDLLRGALGRLPQP